MGQPRYFESEEGEFRLAYISDQVMIDEHSKNATIIAGPSPTDICTFHAEMREDDFSLAGF